MSACPVIPTDAPSASSADQPMVGTIPVMAGKPFKFHGMTGTLVWDGQQLFIEPNNNGIADGVYSQITVTNGAISGVGQTPSPGYTPNICD